MSNFEVFLQVLAFLSVAKHTCGFQAVTTYLAIHLGDVRLGVQAAIAPSMCLSVITVIEREAVRKTTANQASMTTLPMG
ncbi:hypothetical protein NDA01_23775 [Trichocoleus desertorum AS-A10]|uniref:hypothetical protein n=1 Tax=Trichocoleus desertorum TaxID=1481672 RepID=UPI0032974CFF